MEDGDAGAVVEHVVGGERGGEGEAEKAGDAAEFFNLLVT